MEDEKLTPEERARVVAGMEQSLRDGGLVTVEPVNDGDPRSPLERTDILNELLEALDELTTAHVALGGVLQYTAKGFAGWRSHDGRLARAIRNARAAADRLDAVSKRSDAHYELLA